MSDPLTLKVVERRYSHLRVMWKRNKELLWECYVAEKTTSLAVKMETGRWY